MSMEDMQAFVNNLKSAEAKNRDLESIANSDAVKKHKLDECKKNYITGAMDEILSRVYAKSLPLDDDYCDANCEINKARMSDMIAKRGGYEYITDTCGKSPVMNKVLTEVKEACDKKFLDKELHISDIDPADLDYHFDSEEEKSVLDKIEANSNLDTITDVIKKNVEDDAVKEIEKAKAEDEDTKNIEDSLENDDSVDTEEKFESAMSVHYMNRPRTYEPSLFEAIMLSKTQVYGESVTGEEIDQAFAETVMEYTALNVLKALKMESFDRERVQDLANEYLAG